MYECTNTMYGTISLCNAHKDIILAWQRNMCANVYTYMLINKWINRIEYTHKFLMVFILLWCETKTCSPVGVSISGLIEIYYNYYKTFSRTRFPWKQHDKKRFKVFKRKYARTKEEVMKRILSILQLYKTLLLYAIRYAMHYAKLYYKYWKLLKKDI